MEWRRTDEVHTCPRLPVLSKSDSVSTVSSKHRRTLAAVFSRPTPATIPFADLEALFKSLGGTVKEREGSRVKIEVRGEQWRAHRPHPGKEAKRYQVEEARELLRRLGVEP